MFWHVRTVVHYAGDLTATFMYPILAAVFDAAYGRHRDEEQADSRMSRSQSKTDLQVE